MSERRMVNRLKSYWESLRKQNELPIFEHFNQNSVADMWDSCLSFNVTSSSGGKKMYQCNFVGNDLNKAFGKDLKDRYVSSADKRVLPGANLMESLDNSVDSKVFVLSAGQFVNSDHKIVKYRDCVMPFTNFEGTVTNLVVGISWKAF